ncbi:ComEA family DNA-binding protein [Marinigracilibium pacificum]|uniref:DNA uptake protein ComE-like DNA-binding protein n=1 Tax=Marinigracilibium pacificum TaxID=2729599 RepID=A0A848IWD8_9BACT|nr:helix-hairpin-helix domain-containing protein [Marinigracilibium pacificum]NMM48833.1 hypothetical protein [Marinigracilibium pacificum]
MRFIINLLRKLLSSFYFNSREASGFLLLSILLISYCFVLKWGDVLFKDKGFYVDYQYVAFDSVSSDVSASDFEAKVKMPDIGSLDPNNVTFDELKMIGFPEIESKRLIKYRNSGGKFYDVSDLKKIYGVNDSVFMSVEKFFAIEKSSNKPKKLNEPVLATVNNQEFSREKKYKEHLTSFDLNTVDTTGLMKINGIGSVLSKRIIKYRKSLGGFVSTNQLYEVWGLKPAVVDQLLIYGKIEDGFTPERINVSTSSIDSLASHPYISFKEAKLIKSFYESNSQGFERGNLYRIYAIDSVSITRILPYLTF